MIYLQRRGSGAVVQDGIAVEPGTWYVLSAWYRGEHAATPHTGNFWLHLGDPSSVSLSARVGGRMLGASGDWVHVRAFVHTGSHRRVRYQARFFGTGTSQIGRCELRRMAPSDTTVGPVVLDGDFEKGISGARPLDIWGKSGTAQPVVAEDGEFPTGRKSMKVVATSDRRMYLFGPYLTPVFEPGTKVHLGLWAKVERPGMRLIANLGKSAWGKKAGIVLNTEWQRLSQTITIPATGRYQETPHLAARLFLNSAGKPDRPTAIWVDGVSIDIEAAAELSEETRPADRKNAVMNSSFESGLYGWTYRFIGNILNDGPKYEPGYVAIDRSTAGEGHCSLRVRVPGGMDKCHPYGFWLNGVRFRVARDEKHTLSFWAKADRESRVSIYLRPHFQTYGGALTIGKTWERYRLTTLPEKLPTDSKARVAMYITQPGTYWIDGIQAERGEEATEYEPPGALEIGAASPDPFPIYSTDEKPEVVVHACSRLGKEAELRLTCTTRDWRDRTVHREQKRVVVSRREGYSFRMPVFRDQFGAFALHLGLADGATGQVGRSKYIYGILPEPRDVDAEQSWFGVHARCLTLFQDRGWIALPGGTVDDVFGLIRRIGFRWECPMSLGRWRTCQPKPDVWRWADAYVDSALRNGVKIKPILGTKFFGSGKPPKWTQSDRPIHNEYYSRRGLKAFYPRMDLWRAFVRGFVEHYGNRIDAIEILGETGGAEPGPYIEMTRAAREVIREANPRIRIVAPAYPCQSVPYGPEDDTWIGQVLKQGLYPHTDVYSGHFYPPGGEHYGAGETPIEALVDQYGTLEQSLARRMDYLRRAYGTKPVWDTESGQAGRSQYDFRKSYAGYEYINEVSPRTQAERFVRWSVMKKAAGISRTFYHVLPSGITAVHELLETDYSPKPITVACAQLARRIERSRFIRKATIGKATWIYLFEVEETGDARRPLIIYWNYETRRGASLHVPVAASDLDVADLMGNRIEPAEMKDRLRLPLDTSPVYVSSGALTGADLMAKFADGVVAGVTPGVVSVALSSREGQPAIAVGVASSQGAPLSASLKLLELPTGWEASGDTVSIRRVGPEMERAGYIPLAKCGAVDGLEEAVVAGRIGERAMLEAKRCMRVAAAHQRRDAVRVDGNVTQAEYGDAACIALGQPQQMTGGRDLPGASGTSAKLKARWDERALYLGIQVTDDRIVNHAKPGALWKGDCVEIYLDTATDENMNDHRYHEHQGKLVCAPATAVHPEARIELFKTPGGQLRSIDVGKVETASRKTGDGYALEVRIPVSDAGLAAGAVWGFNLSVIDEDDEPGLRAQWMWTGGKAAWRNPHSWGFLLFVP